MALCRHCMSASMHHNTLDKKPPPPPPPQLLPGKTSAVYSAPGINFSRHCFPTKSGLISHKHWLPSEFLLLLIALGKAVCIFALHYIHLPFLYLLFTGVSGSISVVSCYLLLHMFSWYRKWMYCNKSQTILTLITNVYWTRCALCVLSVTYHNFYLLVFLWTISFRTLSLSVQVNRIMLND